MFTKTHIKAKIEQLKTQLNGIDTKITLYAERDWLAAESYFRQYKTLDAELLDLMTVLQTIEAKLETPPELPSCVMNDQCVS